MKDCYKVCEYFTTYPGEKGPQGVCTPSSRDVGCDGLVERCEYPAHLELAKEDGVLHSITIDVPLTPQKPREASNQPY